LARFQAIDTDGHVLERQSAIRKYLESPWNWDNEFPGNLKHLRGHKELSDEAKRKILYENAKELFSL